jgi:carbon storage regulator CsrA
MLVLTRSVGQRVILNPGLMSQITVAVERMSNGEVRLSFRAPRSVRIEREEVWRGRAKAPNGRESADAK